VAFRDEWTVQYAVRNNTGLDFRAAAPEVAATGRR
jgi:hypothetical protein